LTLVPCYIFDLPKSMKRMPQVMSEAPPKRILVIFPGALGDFICFLPALSVLGEDACVDVLARSEFADLAPAGVNVVSLERYEIRRLFVAGAHDEERVRNFFAPYAAIYSWMGSQASEFVLQLESASQGWARVFPFRPRDQKMHQRDYYLTCLNAANRNLPLPAITPWPQAVQWREQFWRRNSLAGKAVLTLAPGSGAAEKNWPIHFFRAVAEWWRRATQGAAVVLTGPVEEERGGFDTFSDCCKSARDLTLAQVAALLAGSDVYLGNDSGITHLAAAVGIRAVALFGPSDVLEWAPIGERVTVLSRNVDCSPCEFSVMKSCSHHKCLTVLHPADAIRELEKLPEVATLTRLGAGIRV
jgi:ADP-heptose:LPS heptosyltransferase